MNLVNTQSLPDPKTTKVLTLEQYQAILAAFYGGELSCTTTTQAYFAAINGQPFPRCVMRALKIWKEPEARSEYLDSLREARLNAEQAVIEAIQNGLTNGDDISRECEIARSTVHPLLRRMTECGQICRVKYKNSFIYSLPAKEKAA